MYNVFTFSCAHLTVILSSSSSCVCRSSLPPPVPFTHQSSYPFRPGNFGLPRFLLTGGRHFITSFGSLHSSILWTWPYHWSCLVLMSSKRDLVTFIFWFTFGAGIFFKILAHPVFEMWILQEPKKIVLWNKRHLEEKKTENAQHV